MSKYLPEIRFETEFDGDNVVVSMLPMSRGAFISMIPAIDKIAKARQNADSDSMAMFELASNVLAEHIINVVGLKDANGNAVDKETMLGKAYFVSLHMECLSRLLKDADLGKLQKIALEVK